MELAEHLADMRHLFASTPEDLLRTLESMHPASLEPYVPGDPSEMVAAIDKMMGVQPGR